MSRALVLGGGVAGICAAFALRDRGHDVELWESRGWLGGRAFSLPEKPGFASRIDNGPHVMLGCYEHMRRLLRRVGTEGDFEQPRALELSFAHADGAATVLRLPSWIPVPLSLPWSLLRFSGMSFGARLRALRGMSSVLWATPVEWTLARWIEKRGQRGGPRSFFWDPLCRAIMNAEAEHVSARLFARTLWQAFSGGAARAAIWVPKRSWSELIGEPSERVLADEGVQVHTGRRVDSLEMREGRVVAVRSADDRCFDASDAIVVSALPWLALHRLVGDDSPEAAKRANASPIVSVYCALEDVEGLPSERVVSLVDGDPFHFFCRRSGASAGEFALLSGGNRALDGVATDEIERLAEEQLRRYFPRARWSGGAMRVVKEAQATFVASPDLESVRSTATTQSIANLRVCGDWTNARLPATLEGAAESGWACGTAS